jgi:hypothetical protein
VSSKRRTKTSNSLSLVQPKLGLLRSQGSPLQRGLKRPQENATDDAVLWGVSDHIVCPPKGRARKVCRWVFAMPTSAGRACRKVGVPI